MTDETLLNCFLRPLEVCADYKPAFGTSGDEGLSLSDFHELYSKDEFYSWIGLDSDLVYSAHKASGGMTSIYRQIGFGSEHLLREIFKDKLSLNDEQVSWEYKYVSNGKNAVHTLDAKISLNDITNAERKEIIRKWLKQAQVRTGGSSSLATLTGAIFEIRQGYKSADSKRQNADLRFGAKSYQMSHLPVMMVLSSQVSETVIQRYRNAGMLVITGTRSKDATISTFSFVKDVVGYDLEDFFKRNTNTIKTVIQGLIQRLLTAN